MRGKSGYIPFWPGGLDDILTGLGDGSAADAPKKGLRTIPPGFTRGLRLPDDEVEDDSLVSLDEIERPVDSQVDDTVLALWIMFFICVIQRMPFIQQIDVNTNLEEAQEAPPASKFTEIDDLLPTTVSPEAPVRHSSTSCHSSGQTSTQSSHHIVERDGPLSRSVTGLTL